MPCRGTEPVLSCGHGDLDGTEPCRKHRPQDQAAPHTPQHPRTGDLCAVPCGLPFYIKNTHRIGFRLPYASRCAQALRYEDNEGLRHPLQPGLLPARRCRSINGQPRLLRRVFDLRHLSHMGDGGVQHKKRRRGMVWQEGGNDTGRNIRSEVRIIHPPHNPRLDIDHTRPILYDTAHRYRSIQVEDTRHTQGDWFFGKVRVRLYRIREA